MTTLKIGRLKLDALNLIRQNIEFHPRLSVLCLIHQVSNQQARPLGRPMTLRLRETAYYSGASDWKPL